MKFDRFLVLLAVVLSSLSIVISLAVFRRDPLGADLSTYNLSSPENTLRSINKIVATDNLRAALELVKVVVEREGNSDAKLFLSDNPRIVVLKSIELSNSGDPKNNGTIISFVKVTVSGVDYYTVQYFRKDALGRFNLGGSSYVLESAKTSEDKAMDSAIAEFRKTGKL